MLHNFTDLILDKTSKWIIRAKDFIIHTKKKIFNLEKTNLELGIYHLNAHNINDAIFRFKLVLLINNRNIYAYYNLARCQYSKGNKEKALESLQKCLEINPKFLEAQFLYNILDKKFEVDEIPISIIEEYYENFSTSYDEEFSPNQGYFVPDDLSELITKHYKKLNTKIKILDLGCGTGLVGESLGTKFSETEITGIDISLKMLIQAKEKQKYNHIYNNFIHQDFRNFIAKTKQKFDIVTACLSLHYQKSFSNTLSSIREILKNDGIVIFAIEKTLHDHQKVNLNYGFENFCYNKSYIKDEIHTSGLHLTEIIESSVKNDRIAFICICKK